MARQFRGRVSTSRPQLILGALSKNRHAPSGGIKCSEWELCSNGVPLLAILPLRNAQTATKNVIFLEAIRDMEIEKVKHGLERNLGKLRMGMLGVDGGI